jgi:hypothetical protein
LGALAKIADVVDLARLEMDVSLNTGKFPLLGQSIFTVLQQKILVLELSGHVILSVVKSNFLC